MIDGKQLWKQRMAAHMAEVRRYGRYMFNDHLLLVLLISIGAGAVFYKRAVDELTSFPYAIVAALLLAFAVTQGGVRTFVKEADAVFLLPVERRLRPYFWRAVGYSFFLHLSVSLAVFVVLLPLHVKFSVQPFSVVAIAIVLLTGWNTFVQWQEEARIGRDRFHTFVRFFVNVTLFYFLLLKQYVWMLVPLLFMVIIARHVNLKGRKNGVQWEQLLADERKRMQAFYRLAHAFVDVPYIKHTVKKRTWLRFFFRLLDRSHMRPYTYLYVRTFFRAGDYFGLFVRLTAIGSIFIFTLPRGVEWFALLCAYATALQLLSIRSYHRGHSLLFLYPLSPHEARRSFMRVLLVIGGSQALIFAMVAYIAHSVFVMLWTFFVVFICYVAVVFYVGKKREAV
ncbi:ABC transporter permease [Anoxybacillus gonensis]|uniref:ABC transporter permease n=1 Tax=Anoxybacillus gonensis TaxID=198467 RepID=A0AAW7TG88_9BACL|nr:ABC transporter permease [Anoxybacillus gonensis]AKS37497.1 ABC transporter permease [Anoxybacillus gonensis]KGP61427.1 ABC transporter permease [Anoxybacillus gonensis]MCX8047253.1 ABC transporter permease [Anoxybacillus gonensis]MDO0876693.1 ABC transporter permease [Anoxybacillus gonensis]